MYDTANRYEKPLLESIMHNWNIEDRDEIARRRDQKNDVGNNNLPQVHKSSENVSGKKEYFESLCA